MIDGERKPVRAWTVDVASKAVRRSYQRALDAARYRMDAGRKRLVAIATDRPEVERHTERLFSVSLEDRQMQEILAPKGPFQRLR